VKAGYKVLKPKGVRYKQAIIFRKKDNGTIDYWEKRAKGYGKISVLNLGHTVKEFNKATEMQKRILLFALKRQLRGLKINS
jgi:type 1 glutamine amidotransferase